MTDPLRLFDVSESLAAQPAFGAGDWRGVHWPSVIEGRCSLHGGPVGPLGVCDRCHREQIAAARRGSREWERPE